MPRANFVGGLSSRFPNDLEEPLEREHPKAVPLDLLRGPTADELDRLTGRVQHVLKAD